MHAPSSTPATGQQRIAVIGAGISGLASAWLLAKKHQVTLFEANAYAGGHTNTVDVTLNGVTAPVDTGFLVFNERTYPNLLGLFAELGVQRHESEMTFAVSMDGGKLEWAGNNLDTLFAQRRNLLSPRFHGMVQDILRFNRESARYLTLSTDLTLGELLKQEGYGAMFADAYLLPMAACIWSCPSNEMLGFPAVSFIRFCHNHGLLQINNRPQWFTLAGGGRDYVRRMMPQIQQVRLNTPVRAVVRGADGITVRTDAGSETFDAVIFATHAPTTLAILQDASDEERQILGSVRYQTNIAWLHTDPALLPVRRKVWSAWNYLGGAAVSGVRPVCVSYLINQLQPLPFSQPVVVTLNPFHDPAPHTQLARFEYEHPVMDTPAAQAQAALPSIQGKGGIWYAGAWTGYGFHEDGLKSALRVVADFDALPVWATL
ncbi:FAD-dependent oxidoreductase [Burkholderiaceae bacterium DAT-1]|nr:FAD-dependent oxidoreductase [Burkholderiaceae bacterium DAT-1]